MKFLFDFFPILLFFIAYKLWDLYVATAVIIAAVALQVAIHWWRHRRVENLHIITLATVVLLGGATLLLHDNRFIMWKPTLVNWLFAVVFLGSQFVGKKTVIERMLGAQITLPQTIWRRLNLGWAVFFTFLGLANLYVAFWYAPDLPHEEREALWVNFKLFGMMGLTIAFAVGQAFYLSRHMRDSQESTES